MVRLQPRPKGHVFDLALLRHMHCTVDVSHAYIKQGSFRNKACFWKLFVSICFANSFIVCLKVCLKVWLLFFHTPYNIRYNHNTSPLQQYRASWDWECISFCFTQVDGVIALSVTRGNIFFLLFVLQTRPWIACFTHHIRQNSYRLQMCTVYTYVCSESLKICQCVCS